MAAVASQGTRNAFMESSEAQTLKVGLDRTVVAGLDRWRLNCPAINRTALVNQILLSGSKKETHGIFNA